MNAYHIQKFCENVEHVIYEKNQDIGGTWLENRYPGMYSPQENLQGKWSVAEGVWATGMTFNGRGCRDLE